MRGAGEIYRAAQLPVLQNRMFASASEALSCQRGDVILEQDLVTGLIYNSAFDPDLLTYGADYQNEQALSAAFSEHLDRVVAIVRRGFPGRDLIEIGCGKGQFLQRLESLGFDVAGFDPTYEGSHPRIRREFFDREAGIRATGIVLRHVLEHVRAPLDFLRAIRDANGGAGRIYIEVPCLNWIADHRAWFDIFYEHVNYFRLGDLKAMFGIVLEAGHCFGGQYIYAVAELASLKAPQRAADDHFSLPEDFMMLFEDQVSIFASKALAGSPPPAIWGGASKGVIYSLLMQRRGVAIQTLIDINPAKQGRFIAASGLQVQSPATALPCLRRGSDLLVMNSNYLSEIRTMTENRFNYVLAETEVPK